MLDNLKHLDDYPVDINQIDYNILLKNDIQYLNIKGNIIIIDKYCFINYENIIKVYDHKYNHITNLKPRTDDDINNFAIMILKQNNFIILVSNNFNFNLILYVYDTQLKLLNNILLKEDIKEFDILSVINNLYLIKFIDDLLTINPFYITNDNIVKDDKIIQIDIKNKKSIIYSIGKNHIFIFDYGKLHILNMSDFTIIKKIHINVNKLYTIFTEKNSYTIVAHEKIDIYDDEINLRQTINLSQIDNIYFKNSYLLIIIDKLVHIYALDHNSLFINVGFIIIESYESIHFHGNNILIKNNDIVTIYPLPKRIYDEQLFLGYGFTSNEENNNGTTLYLNKGKKSYQKDKYNLILGYINNKIIENYIENLLEYKFINEINVELKTDYIFVSNKGNNVLNKGDNTIFIDIDNPLVYFYAEEGSKLEILNSNKTNIIVWKNKGYIEVYFNKSKPLLNIKTYSIIKIIGYTEKVINYNIEINTDIISKFNNIIIEEDRFRDFNTFFPFLNDGIVCGIVDNKIENIDINFKLNNISHNLLQINKFKEIQVKSSLEVKKNKLFYKNNMIDIFSQDIKITNIITNTKIQFNTNIENSKIVKVLFEDPLVILLLEYNLNYRVIIYNYTDTGNSEEIILFNKEYEALKKEKKKTLNDIKFKELEIENYQNIIKLNKTDKNKISLLENKIEEINNTTTKMKNNINDNLENIELLNEQLTNFIYYKDNKLVLTTENNIIYIIKLDNNIYQEILFKKELNEKVYNIRIHSNILLIQTKEQLLLYDINTKQLLFKIIEPKLISFDLYYNYIGIITYDDTIKLYLYYLDDNVQLIIEEEINIANIENLTLKIDSCLLFIFNSEEIQVYKIKNSSNLIKIYEINEKFISLNENILITLNDLENVYKINYLEPHINYINKQIECGILISSMEISSNKNTFLNIIMKVDKDSEIYINYEDKEQQTTLLQFNDLVENKSIIQISFIVLSNERIIFKPNKPIEVCGIIEGYLKERESYLLRGTLITTPNGEVPIEKLEKGDFVTSTDDEEVEIVDIIYWKPHELTNETIPYIIPKNTIKNNYPKHDTCVSPYFKILMPDKKLHSVCKLINSNIKPCNAITNIIYYKLALENNKDYIANSLCVVNNKKLFEKVF